MRNKAISWILTIAMVLSLSTAMPIAAAAAVSSCRIVETEMQYATLDEALSVAASGQTIQLLTDVTYGSMVAAYTKSLALDVNGHTLTVNVSDATCLYAGNEFSLNITDGVGSGSVVLVASGTSVAGLYAYGYGSEINIDATTSVNVTGPSCYGIYATDGGIVSVTGDITVTGTNSYGAGAFSGVYGSLITIDGEINATNYINTNGTVFTGPEQSLTPTTKSGYLTFLRTGDSANPQSTVWLKEVSYVAEVDGMQYETLDEAIVAAAVDEDTIKLLADINYTGELRLIADTWINLNGFSINVVNDDGIALYADGYDLDISGTGALNVTGSSFGVFIRSGASIEVTNATATADAGKAVYALDPNCRVTLLGNATANGQQGTAVYVEGTGSSSATIHGDVYAQGIGGIGVCAVSESAVTVMGRIYATNYLQVGDLIKEEGDYASIESNYYVYTDDAATVRARQEVCELNGTPYLFLEDALAAAESGDTITLLADIRYVNNIVLTDTDIHFDLDTYTLDVGRTGADGSLKVDGSTLTIDDTNGGKLNIVTGYIGVKAVNGGTATVSSILDPTTSNSLNGYGIVGENGGSVTVTGDIKVLSYIGEGLHLSSGSSAHVMGDIYSLNGITVQGDGSVATIEGNVSASSGNGVQIGSSGSVVIHGNVQSETRGIAGGAGGGSVHVMGNVTANRWEGINAYSNADIVVDGNVTSPYGPYAWGEGTTVLIKQNTTTTDPAYWGAYAFNGAQITVNGMITAADSANYVKAGDTVMTEDSFAINGNGYYLYTDGTSTVMVQINTCLIDGCSISLEDGGFTQYSVIDGETYYHVTSPAQLAHINSHKDLNYLQMNDIDLIGIDWTPIGSRFVPGFELGYNGTFDGNGYLISNLTIGSSSAPRTGGNQTQAGLFGAIKYNAILKNISVTVDIHTDGVTDVGGLVGHSEANGTIANCAVDGSISTTGEDTRQVGGLIGYVSNTSILECSSNVTITVEDSAYKVGGLIGSHGRYSYDKLGNISNSIFTGSVDGGNSSYTGGITGTSYGNTFIMNSINAGSVTASRGNVGGIAGQIHNNVANCYNIGSVSHSETSSDKIGGIVAYIDGGYVKNCYNAGTVTTPGSAVAGALVAVVGQYDTATNLYSDETVNPSLNPVERIDANGTSYYLYNLTTEEMKGAAPSQPLEYASGLTASGIIAALNGWIDEFDYSEYDITFARWDIDSSVNSGYPYLVGVPMENNAELESLSITEGTLSPAFSKDIDVYNVNMPNSTDELIVEALARSKNASISINGDTVSTSAVQLVVGNNTIEVIVTAENGVTTNRYTINIKRAAASSSGGGSSYTSPTIVVITEEENGVITNSTKLPASTIAGKTSANITTAVVNAFLSKIDVSGGGDKNDLIEMEIDMTTGVDELSVNILQKDLARMVEETDARLGLISPFVSIIFDSKALETISEADNGGTVVISAGIIDNSLLSVSDQAKVKDRPVYDLNIMNGNTKISDFKGGHATVTIPYTLKTGENPNAIIIYHLTDDGDLKPVRGYYDATLQSVVFKTTHFSHFVISYNLVVFEDVVEEAWYKNAVDFIAARGITSGIGEKQYGPDNKLTRAQFVVLLMNAYQISTQNQGAADQMQNFTDAGNTYYTDYLMAAKALGIVNGIGNNMFAPDKCITRQEMFVILNNALKVIDEMPAAVVNKELSSFDDSSQVAEWALEALSTLIKSGIVSGSNNKLSPTTETTRAEIAQVLYNLLSK